MEDRQLTPPFFTMGITYLIPKADTPCDDPIEYQPITCLPTMFKQFMSLLITNTYKHLEDNKTDCRQCHNKTSTENEETTIYRLLKSFR